MGRRISAAIVNSGGNEPELVDVLRIPTRVKSIREEFRETSGHKLEDGTFPIYRTSLGWFVNFEGSWESLYAGAFKPGSINEGDVVWIVVQKEKKL